MVDGRALGFAIFVLLAGCGKSESDKSGGAGTAGSSSQAGSGGASSGRAGAATSAGTSGSAGRGAAGAAGTGGGASGNGGVAGNAAGSAGDAGEAGAGENGGEGGAGTGGAAMAGAGADSGGSAGAAAGNAGAGSGGAPFGYSECRRDEDCVLVDDCCTCNALPRGEAIDSCPGVCIQNACARGGVAESDVVCVGGRCVLERSCGVTTPGCSDPEPTCPDGHLITTNGDCWGACVPAEDCVRVSTCDVCEGLELACATGNGISPRCVTTPTECAANPTCGCMGLCDEDRPCSDPNSEVLNCVCENC